MNVSDHWEDLSEAEWLQNFVRESNRIEGILREPTQAEINAHANIIVLRIIRVDDLEAFVKVVQPGAVLRRKKGMNVRVGNHIAPEGGPEIPGRLEALLAGVCQDKTKLAAINVHFAENPFGAHRCYETLHPFIDGNGRSGRVLWLWQMLNGGSQRQRVQATHLGFLHSWYYQTLEASPLRDPAGRNLLSEAET